MPNRLLETRMRPATSLATCEAPQTPPAIFSQRPPHVQMGRVANLCRCVGKTSRHDVSKSCSGWATYSLQQLVRHLLPLELLEELLAKLLKVGEGPLRRQLSAFQVFLAVTVQGNVEVEPRRWLSNCKGPNKRVLL